MTENNMDPFFQSNCPARLRMTAGSNRILTNGAAIST